MRISMRFMGRAFFMTSFPLRWAYGIKSGEPFSGDHIALFDIDATDLRTRRQAMNYLLSTFPLSKWDMRETPNGLHFILYRRFPFKEVIKILAEMPNIDLTFLAIGLKRGYWFLETRELLEAPEGFKLDFMRIERAKNEKNEALEREVKT